jgi:hypothetical protein
MFLGVTVVRLYGVSLNQIQTKLIVDFQLLRYTVHTSPCFYECGSNNYVVLSRAATNLMCKFSSVPDPGSGAFDPGVRNRFFPDPGSRISNAYF